MERLLYHSLFKFLNKGIRNAYYYLTDEKKKQKEF